MSRYVAMRWMLVLLLLLPTAARAGEGRRWDEPRRLRLVQVPIVETTPRAIPDSEPVAPPVHPLWQRLLVEGGAGVGTGLAGALVGLGTYMLGSGVRLLEPGEDPTVLPFMLAGAAIGFPLGVWWGGELMMGDGSLLATFGGAAVGGLGAVGLWALSERSSPPLSGVLKGVAIPLPVVGSFLGYELSSGIRKKAKGLQLRPAVVLSSQHRALVLAGCF
ncbi:hypothetical protein [Archangium violaceum]|uniref:hypothetical protein n=1 Tax=Archangium violaceum TaxID=83451 RepID=UPI001269A336|nr:hypothetical protein [Archangium violaceum]